MGDGDAAVSSLATLFDRRKAWPRSFSSTGRGMARGVWRRVARLLSQSGHEVFTPTLTGVGERSHLLKPDVNLEPTFLMSPMK
jgi:predicted alpha/beta hydrolase